MYRKCSVVIFSKFLAFSLIVSFAANHPAPDALKVFIDFRPVWEASRAALMDRPPLGMGLKLADNEQQRGFLVTETHRYASGTLTRDHLAKIAIRREASDGTWEQVRYKLQVKVEPLAQRETRITADALIEALKRSFTGKEEWVTLPSNGNLEETFLLYVGRKLFGDRFSLESRKKNFWQRDPRYVPGPDSKIERMPKPDTKRW